MAWLNAGDARFSSMTRLGQPGRFSASGMAEMLRVDKVWRDVRC